MKLKNIYLFLATAILAIHLAACSGNNANSCHISGTIPEKWNGVRVFLVPNEGPQDAAHVDSIEIADGKFEFTKDTVGIYRVLVDFRYRDGLQPLIVATEPGELTVVLGETSSALGTPQNDSLDVFKRMQEDNQRRFLDMKNRLDNDQHSRNEQLDSVRAFQADVRQRIVEFAKRQPEGVVRSSLLKMYNAK